jgi:hypothetical protein
MLLFTLHFFCPAVAEPHVSMEFSTMRFASKIPALVLLAAFVAVATPASAQLGFLVINELDSDTPTAPVNDELEFIELYDGGIGNQSLAGYTIVFYNGGSGSPCATGTASYFAMDLTGSTDANGYYLIGNPLVVPTPVQTWPPNTLQNGADAVALYFGTAAAAFPTGTVATATNLVDAVVYHTSDSPPCTLLATLTPNQPQVNENLHLTSANESIYRCPNGQGGPLATTGYQAGAPTPGASNNGCAAIYQISITQFGGCGTPITLAVSNAGANAELFNVISLACSTPPGGGPLFGLSVGPGSGDPLQQFFLPLGSPPFHVNADINGNYGIVVPTGPCPGTGIPLEGVSVQVIGLSVTAVTQTTTCVTVTI